MADMTVSGIVSGMDWEGMITQLVENAQKPAKVQMNKRTNLTNKKALFQEMQELTEKIQSSLTTLRLSSTYEAKKIALDRVDSSASAKGVLTAKVNADARPGVYTVEVKQLAKAKTLRSNQLTTEIGKQALGGKETSTLWISNLGQKVGVEVKASDTLKSLASRINNTIKTLDTPMNLTASVVDNRLIFKSDNTGLPKSTSTETTTYKAGQNTALKTLSVSLDTLKDGDIVIKDASGNKWTNGKDFDIVQGAGGNEIRWRTNEANTIPTTYSYTAKYEAAAVDKYTQTDVPRGSGSVDSNVLDFAPTGTLTDRMTITDSASFTYKYGEDFEVSGTSIRWLSGKGPEAGKTYTVDYTAAGGEVFDIDMTRGNADTLKKTLTYSDVSEHFDGFSITTAGGTTYTYGTDFTIGNADGTPDGTPTVVWFREDGLPAAGTEYTVTYNADGKTFTEELTRGSTSQDKLEIKTDAIPYSKVEGMDLVITTQDGKICYEGTDFTVSKGENNEVVVNWKDDAAWTLPDPGSTYYLNELKPDGTMEVLGAAARTKGDEVDFEAAGITRAAGSTGRITDVTYTQTTEDGKEETFSLLYKKVGEPSDPLEKPYLAISADGKTLNWKVRPAGADIKLPADNASLTVSYTYNDTEFSLDDKGSGLLSALGLDLTDEEHYTAAQDAVVLVDGNEVEISANYIDYDNDILKGVRLDFKGEGIVSVDITQDTDKTVEAIETFVESYNTLMDWINTRSSEKRVNTDYSEDSTTLSRNSDDFHTSWGLLYGNSYLRSTKSTLRSIVSQNYAFTFKSRTSSEPVYGDMGYNGIKRKTLADGTEVDGSTTLRIKVGDHTANITITSSDTLETIAAKINNEDPNPDNNEAWSLHYNDEDKNLSEADLAKKKQSYVMAEVVNGKLVIKQGSTAGTNEISLTGTTALNALKMNTTYKGLYQIGIETTSDNYGISGEIEFDSQAFLDAMEENPEETEQLMLAFAKQMDTQVKTMLQSSGEYSGTLKTEITNLETQITSIDEYLNKFQDRLDRMEESLRSQYAAAEERISQLSQQASSISGILTQLSGGGNAS